ncbi:tetratricopeptide repeat protein [Chelatococcus sp. SYSU_G07232]|uniref:Tetratricopeptide repeat protein n=1 Tax=Chelatococcus albus TaxID=3047466 RepID=A0ABT7AC84_9HYPH|nr:tetratricopeptide repeat protein [Chelatococcus sp. SYSU_G07232]MDJ1156975.1 tetratricopeptide repeat protein [Chelatococcus sp. SYSU_G07232]
MTDIFREIDEELRRDKAAALWARYGNIVIGLAILLVIATGAWRYWQHRETQKAEAAGARFEEALTLARDGKGEEAERTLEAVAKDAPNGYRTLARFRLAAEVGKRDPEAGAAAFDALAADTTVGGLLQDLARLRAVMLRFDGLDPRAVSAKLEPLAAPSSAWRHSARELLGLAALKAGDYEAAGRWFDQIVADRETQGSLRQRAEIYLGLVRGGPVTKQ